MVQSSLSYDDNPALRPGVLISASIVHPTGPGGRDPSVLLNETAYRLSADRLTDIDQSKTYDTYDGQNAAHDPDWYAIEFPEPVRINCVEMTMGFPYRDGGWWTSLGVEVSDDSGGWRPIAGLNITPAYDFADDRRQRRPFETYALTFDEVHARAIRIIGRPGGLAQFTSLARLAVYQRDLSRWNPADLPSPPLPKIFRLVPPHIVWDLSENLVKLSGLTIGFPYMEFYLDERRANERWRRMQRNYHGEPELWFLVGESIGWDVWNRLNAPHACDRIDVARQPYLRMYFHDTLAAAVAPVVVEGEVLAEMKTHPVVLRDQLDWRRHQAYAEEYGISWPAYRAAIRRSLHMTREQLEGAAGLMGTLANTMADLVHRLDMVQAAGDQRSQQRKGLVRRAIALMEDSLEEPLDIAGVAQKLALSPSYFSTIFTEETGRNPSDFLIDLRLERAKEYLAHTEMSVMEVSVALGYSRSYFTRLFNERIGCSPGVFARRTRVQH